MVAPIVAGALIGAGASVLSGVMNNSSNTSANRQNIALQKEFAQHGIQWKVADAKRAGIHPLYALGASTNMPTVRVGGNNYDYISKMGQSVGSAVANKETSLDKMERIARINLLDAQAQAFRDQGQSDGTINSIETNKSGTVTTQKISPGQPNVIEQPALQTASSAPGLNAGKQNLEVLYQNINGYYKPRLSQNASEPMESSWFDQFGYMWDRGKRVAKAVWYYYNQEGKGAAEHRKFIRELRKAIPDKPKKGHEYRFDPIEGFIERKIINGETYLYDKKPPRFQVRKGNTVIQKIRNRPN